MAWSITSLSNDRSGDPVSVEVNEDSGNLYLLMNSQTYTLAEVPDDDIDAYLSANSLLDVGYVGVMYFGLSAVGDDEFTEEVGDMYGVDENYPGSEDGVVLIYDLNTSSVATHERTNRGRGQVTNQIGGGDGYVPNF